MNYDSISTAYVIVIFLSHGYDGIVNGLKFAVLVTFYLYLEVCI